MRTVGGLITGIRSSTSASAYSACSRAAPPPVKNACNVCAASWTTRSPSIRPGQPRGKSIPTGLNMQSFMSASWVLSSGLGVDDDVGDLRLFEPDALLDLARPRVRICERGLRVESKCQERDETRVRAQEAHLARRQARDLADDALDRAGVQILHAAGRRLRERLEVSLHGIHLGHGVPDRPLDLLCNLVCILER